MTVCIVLILLQVFVALRASLRKRRAADLALPMAGGTPVDSE
jgi:hypothetical protein